MTQSGSPRPLQGDADGWAEVFRVPFEQEGASVSSL